MTIANTPSPSHGVRLRRLSRWQAETLREDLADLYVESSRARPRREYDGREGFLRRLTGDMRRPGFALLVGEDTAFVGCVYGFPVRREGAWWRGFVGALPRSVEQLTESGHVFAIAETLVHPRTMDRNLARRLHERLLADHHATLGATLVDRTDSTAFDAFLSWGWQDIGHVRRPSHPASPRPSAPEVLRALVLPLGPHTATGRPDGSSTSPG
ncbi:hypothetical protein ACFWWT_38320 [Streptomyces sp. NPDC058676]|uniref:hypothetical protein n=1 Tax=unclassified Streptomyces TaxID=2593676 RepID=UPI0036643CDA